MKILKLIIIFFPLIFRRRAAKRYAKYLNKKSRKYDYNRAMQNAKTAAGYVAWYKGTDIQEVNTPKERSYIIVANHSSFFDIIALLAAPPAPLCFVAKVELKDSWIVNPFATSIGSYFIDRDNPRQAIKLLKKLKDEFHDHDHSVVFFPEGTRNDELGDFQMSAFQTARQLEAPILPVALLNAKRVSPKVKRKHRVKVVCGAPIHIKKVDDATEAMKRCHAFVKNELQLYQSDVEHNRIK